MQDGNYKLNKGNQTKERHSNYKAVEFYVRDARAPRTKAALLRICARRARAAHEITRGGSTCARHARAWRLARRELLAHGSRTTRRLCQARATSSWPVGPSISMIKHRASIRSASPRKASSLRFVKPNAYFD